MPSVGTARAWTPAVIAAACLLALAPASAHAAASATITGCGGDHMTVVGKVAAGGREARKARGANLEVQFFALPVFAMPRPGGWRDLGKRTATTDQQAFTGLAPEGWWGVMSWRFRKGGRTVLSGDERTQPRTIAGVRGVAFCTLPEGSKPVDSTPPQLTITPSDGIWHRGPTPVQLVATDDFSGVRRVSYSLDSGPPTDIRNGSTFAIDTEGVHSVKGSATDVAGNTTTVTVTVLVDKSAPSKPQLQRPFSVTVSTTPRFQWTASTDSGSGIKGYFLAIKRASDGSLVAFMPYDASTTSVSSPQTLVDGETYVASVVAVDNTDQPFSTESDPLTFRVDSHPKLVASDPASGAILSGARKSGNLTLTLDRPADPSTVAGSTALIRNSESGSAPAYTVSCAAMPCSTIVVKPSSTLGEGRYTLTINGLKSEEGAAFPVTSVAFAVAFREDNDSDNSATANVCGAPPTTTVTDATPVATNLTANSGETGIVTFDYQVTGSGTGGLRVMDGATPLGDTGALTGSGTGRTLSFPLASGSHTISIQYYASCPAAGQATTITVSNLVASRTP
jgi:hypothetical protein